MDRDWILFIAAGAVAFAVTLLATPWSKKLSERVGAIDYPRDRGMHKKPIPRMGGVAIIAGCLAGLLVTLPFMADLRNLKFVGFVVGALIIAVLGALDDVYSLKAHIKFVVQIVAASIVAATGTRIQFINLFGTPLWGFVNSFDIFITIFWIVGVTNAVNLIDGIDGLAAGVSAISGICLTALCVISGSPVAVVFAITLTGSCLGFVPRNFSPAEVIMGDTGATFLGFTLAVSSIIGVFKGYAVLSIVIVILAMALPIFDTAFAMLRRLINRKPIMSADRGHLHHRLVDAGFTQKQTVVIMYIISAAAAVVAILLAVKDVRVTAVTGVSIAVTLTTAFVYFKRLGERQRDESKDAAEKTAEDAGFELHE